jgi:type I restriction enzyme, S subunit
MECEEVPFTSLLKTIVDNRGRTCPISPDGVGRPLIATNCIRNERLYPTYDTTRYVSEETYRTWFRGHPEPGDLIFVCKGSPGRVSLAPDPVDFCIAQDMVAIRADPSKIYPPYLFAILRSPLVQARIGNMHVGTLIPHFKKGDFDKLKIPRPDERTQRAVGDTYLLLSKQIELNRRMNQTLEAIARALFQSWFVDFDPVRAKQLGRPPAGMDIAMAGLFPESLSDSDFGKVPAGWTVRSLDQVARYLNGLALQKYPSGDGATLPVIKIAQLRKGDATGADRCSADLPSEFVVNDGDVLFSWSGSLEVEIWCGGQGALNQHLFKVTSSEFPKWFYYLWTLQHLRDFRQTAAGKATTMGHIQRHHLNAAKVLVPSTELIARMTPIMSPLLERIILNRQQAHTLARTRDALLSKLLSGELQVSAEGPRTDIP